MIEIVLKFADHVQDVYKMHPERRAEQHGIRNYPSAKASHPAASSSRGGRKAVARTQGGRRSLSLKMEEHDEDDLGSDF